MRRIKESQDGLGGIKGIKREERKKSQGKGRLQGEKENKKNEKWGRKRKIKIVSTRT